MGQKSSILCTRLRQDPVLSSTDLHQLQLTQTCCLQLSATSGQEQWPQVVLVGECLRKSLASLSNTALRSALAFVCYHKAPFQVCAGRTAAPFSPQPPLTQAVQLHFNTLFLLLFCHTAFQRFQISDLSKSVCLVTISLCTLKKVP